MDIAKKISNLLLPPFVVISEEQSRGYGQMNRKWFSPLGGLWFTEVVNYKKVSALSLFFSVVIVQVLERRIQGIKVKWPNDIYLNGKKLAGILTKVANNTATIGIGINVENNIPLEINNISISIKEITDLNRFDLLNEILKEQDELQKIFLSKGFFPFVNFYNSHLIFLNKKVIVESKGRIEGRAVGVNTEGALLVKTKNKVETIFSGTVVKF
jgi:BirA family biotin operon repressor/biotin-[acetyl-CoA-carboxylase] ligase